MHTVSRAAVRAENRGVSTLSNEIADGDFHHRIATNETRCGAMSDVALFTRTDVVSDTNRVSYHSECAKSDEESAGIETLPTNAHPLTETIIPPIAAPDTEASRLAHRINGNHHQLTTLSRAQTKSPSQVLTQDGHQCDESSSRKFTLGAQNMYKLFRISFPNTIHEAKTRF